MGSNNSALVVYGLLSELPRTNTLPLFNVVAISDTKFRELLSTVTQLLVDGIYSSALGLCRLFLPPPTINTFPVLSNKAVWPDRSEIMLPTFVQPLDVGFVVVTGFVVVLTVVATGFVVTIAVNGFVVVFTVVVTGFVVNIVVNGFAVVIVLTGFVVVFTVVVTGFVVTIVVNGFVVVLMVVVTGFVVSGFVVAIVVTGFVVDFVVTAGVVDETVAFG